MRDPRNADGRAALLEELDRYAPVDLRERAMVRKLRAFVSTHDRCFERSLATGHVTGSAWIVARPLDAALLVHHRKLDKWLQPGGHADGDCDLRGVARREALEETGASDLTFASDVIFDVDVHAIPARAGEPEHEHFDVRFAFFANANVAPRVSEESHAVAWVAFADIERYAVDDSVRRLMRKTATLAP